MTRAYIRLDPAFDERKEAYPDGPYAALAATFCLAEFQPDRGRFRSFDYLTRLLGRRGRHAKYLLDHGDVVILEDGRVYVDGWDEWQEGDWKVAERVSRIRSRERRTVHVTPDVTPPVTVPVTVDVTADRLSVAERSVSGGDSGAEQSAPERWDAPETEALVWLSRHGCDIRPGNGYHRHLVTAVERHGVNAIVGMFDRLSAAGMKPGDTKGYLFGAVDALNAKDRPSIGALEAEDREEERRTSFEQRAAATRARNAELAAVIEKGKP